MDKIKLLTRFYGPKRILMHVPFLCAILMLLKRQQHFEAENQSHTARALWIYENMLHWRCRSWKLQAGVWIKELCTTFRTVLDLKL